MKDVSSPVAAGNEIEVGRQHGFVAGFHFNMVRYSICGHYRAKDSRGYPETVQYKNKREIQHSEKDAVQQKHMFVLKPCLCNELRSLPGNAVEYFRGVIDFLPICILWFGIHAPLNKNHFEDGEQCKDNRIEREGEAMTFPPKRIGIPEEIDDKSYCPEASKAMPCCTYRGCCGAPCCACWSCSNTNLGCKAIGGLPAAQFVCGWNCCVFLLCTSVSFGFRGVLNGILQALVTLIVFTIR